MLSNVSSTVFSESESITLQPCISAEWNHNLFNTPYITVAGNGTKATITLEDGVVESVTSGGKENFTTKKFVMEDGAGSVTYNAASLSGNAYKIITYIKTDSSDPVIINVYGEGSSTQFGSSQSEVSELGWERIVTYVGSSGTSDVISSLNYTISAHSISGNNTNAEVMFTLPEIYETTLFDYKNHSFFPTESVFSTFRPGESYVTTGNSANSAPSLFRKITTEVIADNTENFYSPVSSILRNPGALFLNPPVPMLKHAAPTNTSSYKYFVSDSESRSISAVYAEHVHTNKLVIKINNIMTTPTINIDINENAVLVRNTENVLSADIELPKNSDEVATGVLVLYWNGSEWTKTPWSTMPTFASNGSLNQTVAISKITVTQISQVTNTAFESYSSDSLTVDLERMHLVEISPRLEVDLSDFVMNFSIEKSLDSKESNLPISATNSNTASISLSGLPLMSGSSIVPIFSSQNNTFNTAISKMLRKGIKFYTGYKLSEYSILSSGTVSGISSYVPGGVFYSESWDESDIDSVSIQCFDISKYLQSLPAPDYVSNQKSAFDVISDILDLAGFTDYDYDSLYKVCNNKNFPLDIYYYSVYSKDTTLIASINELLLPYQIAVYIDEYGIMKFLSLQDIMSPTASSVASISDANVYQNGFSIQNKAKPGKISIKYTEPKIKQSLSLRNVQENNIKSSPSFVYVTSNDILWEQQKTDSVGFNYIKNGIEKQSTTLSTNGGDIDSIFYAYNRDSNGYAIIENEVVSFEYKEYELSTGTGSLKKTELVSIKNNLELQSEITRFIKKYGVQLRQSFADITDAVGDGEYIVYTANNSFKEGDKVSVSKVSPVAFNTTGTITNATSTSFTIASDRQGEYVSGGLASIGSQYDMTATPTGNINNVRRGLFGTVASAHKRATSLSSKNLTATNIISNTSGEVNVVNKNTENSLYPSISRFRIYDSTPLLNDFKVITVSPTTEVDKGYHTYSVKFELPPNTHAYAGLFFNKGGAETIYVTLNRIKLNNSSKYRYIMQIETDSAVTHWADVTKVCNDVINNFPKIVNKTKLTDGTYSYGYIQDQAFDLQAVWEESDGSNGEDGTPEDKKTIFYVFLNGVKISGWQVPGGTYDEETNPLGTGWETIEKNEVLGTRKNPSMDIIPSRDTEFGFCVANDGYPPQNVNPSIEYDKNTTGVLGYLREIYATVKPLQSRKINNFLQDSEFLDGIIQDRPLALNSPSYMMQTTPEIKLINTYDVEYGTPAAVTANHSTIQYMWNYYAGNGVDDKGTTYKKLVNANSIAYSTLINSGHRGRIALANNASHQVWIKKEADSVNNFSINFTMYTHEAIVPSDPELIDYVVDIGNASEVVQIDTKWIQSKTSARKVMKLIESGLTGFSKDISLKIFGNPLFQVGDIVTFSYSLNGISQQRCIVSSISHSFENGLSTSLVLNRIQE